MATYVSTLEVIFSPLYTGQTGNVGYKITDSAGVVQVARTTTGVAEKANAPGTYYVRAVVLNDSWLPAEVDWDITGQAGIGATEVLTSGIANLAQAIPLTNTAQTVGDALNAARAQGFGPWTQSGNAFTLYAADGVTPVKVFTLDDATAPQRRF